MEINQEEPSKEKLIIKKEFFIRQTDGQITQYYEVLKKIGEGASAKVYKVKEKSTGEIRAMKQVEKSKLPDVKYFETEIKILSLLDHPNIVRLFEVFEDSKNFYLIMELMTGGNLITRMNNNRYKEKSAAILMEQIVSAIAYCHEKGICHRDLKPQNVLFCDESPNSPIKVVDFGISKIFDPSLTELQKDIHGENKLKKMDSQIGTLFFISPEIIKGSYNEKCDIWSLGIILYYLLSGCPPFEGGNDNILIEQILESKIKFPKEYWKNISESAKDLISKMLCSEKKRLTAQEVINHKWFKTKLKKKLEKKITFNFDKLSKYKNFNILKKSIMLFLASRLNSEEANNIAEIFKKIDECKKGTIDFEDFKSFMINNQNQEIIGGENDEEIRKKFLEIDVDRNNKIDFTEFLAANMDKAIYKDKEKLRVAFDLFDTDKNGIISKDDIISILKMENLYDAKKLVSDLIDPNDINKDGKIDFDEFCKLME